MFKIKIENKSEKDIYFKGRNPSHDEKKIKKGDVEEVDLNHQSRMTFVFYVKDSQNGINPATYDYFKINNPCDHIEIDIEKDNEKEKVLKTIIKHPKGIKHKLTPTSVEAGVKE